jgi:hypothetical protein
VCGEDHRPVGILSRDLVEFLDKDRAFRLQTVDDEFVVNDLMAHIDRAAVFLQGQFDDLYGPVDACAKAARRAQKHGKLRLCS